MKFYEELQLNQAGSKELIKNSKNNKEKFVHICIYLFKIIITLIFCMTFVIGYSVFCGSANSIVGVVILLFILVFRNAHLSIKTSHAIPSLIAIFTILAIGPQLSSISNIFIAFLVNATCIFLLLFLGCHNVRMFNHSTLVLGYLLLYGYKVSGDAYTKRLEGLLVGALITVLVYYKKHRKKTHKLKLEDFFKEFDIKTDRTQWQLSMTFAISSILFISSLIHLPRPMWAGIAAMSIITPFTTQHKEKVKGRIIGNILGSLLIFLVYKFCPDFIYDNIGIIGGICVGLSATYSYQSIFNTFGAIYIASTLLGFPGAIFYRILNNTLGAIYGLVFNRYFCKLINKLF